MAYEYQSSQDKIIRRLKRIEFVHMYKNEFEILRNNDKNYGKKNYEHRDLCIFLGERAINYIGYSANTYKMYIVYSLLRLYKIQNPIVSPLSEVHRQIYREISKSKMGLIFTILKNHTKPKINV